MQGNTTRAMAGRLSKESRKLRNQGLWCVPTDMMAKVMKEAHSVDGHRGTERLLYHTARQFLFADEDEAKKMADKVQRLCAHCQATEPPHQPSKLKIVPTPVPPRVMSSVSVDIFIMPELEWQGATVNCFAACVDRHSGWVVTTIHHTRGLTAAVVAQAMYEKWWSPHGIPSVITSDRGPQFKGAWWRAMCALHGVHHAYAQAYHHPANGRAEQVGAQLQRLLRKRYSDSGTTWPEDLPRALRNMHDTKGPHSLTPYEILYGRKRPMA